MMSNWGPSRTLVLTWLGLIGLLALTIVLAYQPLGRFNTVAALGIGVGKALLVAVIFMKLRRASGVVLLVAGASVFWLGILFWLGLMDFVTRG
jgi:cytochrome c oxidase subunit IV